MILACRQHEQSDAEGHCRGYETLRHAAEPNRNGPSLLNLRPKTWSESGTRLHVVKRAAVSLQEPVKLLFLGIVHHTYFASLAAGFRLAKDFNTRCRARNRRTLSAFSFAP